MELQREPEKMFFNLTGPLQYSKRGDFTNTVSLEFSPPSMETYDEVSDLAQYVMAAMMDARQFAGDHRQPENSADSTEVVLDAKSIKIMLFNARSVKFKHIADTFQNLAIKTGTTDGEIKLTQTLIKKLSPDDYTRLICEYIANFIIPSLL